MFTLLNRVRVRALWVAAALLLSGASESAAQTVASPPVLTLPDALRKLAANNADWAAARARIDQASAVVDQAKTGYFPRVSVGGGFTYNGIEARIPFVTGYMIRDFGEGFRTTQPPFDPANPLLGAPTSLAMIPKSVQEVVVQRHDQWGAQLEVQQPLWIPTLESGIAAARAGAEASRLGAEVAGRELNMAVIQLYYGAFGAQAAARVQERLIETQRAHERDAQVKVQNQVQPRIVLTRAQIDRVRAEQDLVRAQLGADAARSALAALIGEESTRFVVAEPPVPSDDLLGPIDTVDGSTLNAWIEERPDLLAARAGLQAAQLGRTGIDREGWPTVAATARGTVSNVQGFTNNYGQWAAGLGVQWSAYDGGLRGARAKQADARVAESRWQVESLRQKALDEARRALLDVSTARANRIKAAEQRRLAQQVQQMTKVGFDSGTSTYLEVSDAQAMVQGAELADLSETLNARLALLRLAKAAGKMDRVLQASGL